MLLDDGPEDELHWQDRVSSRFDRLVAFASTELTKTRRSIEENGGPGNSCNASPDSGINQSNDGRTFLSSSSSASQIDIPLEAPTMYNQNNLKQVVPIIKSSPVDPVDSPPLSEGGLPRTPSPSGSPSHSFISDSVSGGHLGCHSAVKIPLKYQRQSKLNAVSEKHFKKKFRERTWEYEYEESYGSDAAIPNHLDKIKQEQDDRLSLKSSKFRPKGKDWDWNTKNSESGLP